MIRFKEYLERRARRAAFMSVCLAGLAVFGGLSLGSCANEDLGKDNDKDGGDRNAAVTFNVSEAQNDAQEAAAKAMPGVPVTRAAFSEQLGMMNLTPEDLTTQRLAVQGAAGTDLCLIETTIAGVNPMRQDNRTATAAERAKASGNGSTTGTEAATRANITTMTTLGHFSSIGYRGTSATGISNTPWFHDKDTNPDGTLVNTIYWWAAQPFGKFFAIAPREAASYTKLKISPDTYAGTPYVDFEVEPDVKNQKDLMTACSGLVHYDTPNVAPRTDLKFRHALTAVRFKVGQNLSYSKTITKVEIIGAKNKGRYVLPTNGTSTGTWSSLDASTATFTLG
ncbi:fimbrillin family protein, partial [Hallella seregens]|uniref:fimbrillin family protein n=1 Tax=Hallella seregens TaxID=52229 RepID=UPI000480E497